LSEDSALADLVNRLASNVKTWYLFPGANISADPAPGALFVESHKTAKNGKKK